MSRWPRRAGVTLLELLIAVSLLSLLSVGMLMSMRVGLSALEKANTRLMANRRAVGAQRILEQQIAGFIPVVGDCLGQPGGQFVATPFFQGEPESMRFVSNYSLGQALRGYPQILEFQVIPGENGRGVRLVVNEHLYSGPLSAGRFCFGPLMDPLLGIAAPRFPPIEVGPHSFVLADRLAFCRFSFREPMPPPQFERWVPHWVLPRWPSAVRIEMAPLEAEAGRVQPLTLTAPIRVNRLPHVAYTD